MTKNNQAKPRLITTKEAAEISRELAERFGRPKMAVSAKTIYNQGHTFRHLFAFKFSEVGRWMVLGVRASAWRNHVMGRLSLGRSIFGTDGYETLGREEKS